MKNNSKNILIVLLGILPFYLFNIYNKLYGSFTYSVTSLLVVPLLLALSGLMVLFFISKKQKTKEVFKLEFKKENVFSDLLITFLLLIVIYILEPVSAITFQNWFAGNQKEKGEIINVLTDILSNPFTAIWFMLIVVAAGQIFLQYIRVFLLKYSIVFSDSLLGRNVSIILVALFLSLLNIDDGVSGIIFEFLSALLFNYTFVKTNRIHPLIYAGFIYQLIALINFGMHFCWN